jgi:hypothetical protein
MSSAERVTANCASKLQIRTLVREGAPQHEDRECPTGIKIWSWVLDGGGGMLQRDGLPV